MDVTIHAPAFCVSKYPLNHLDWHDPVDGEMGDQLGLVRMNDDHFLDTNAPFQRLAMLGLERKDHAFLNLDRMIQGPDAGNHRRVVLGKAKTMAPKVGGRLVFFFIAPGFLR